MDNFTNNSEVNDEPCDLSSSDSMSLNYEDGSMSMVNNWHYYMEKRDCETPTKDDPKIEISPPLLPGEYMRFIGRCQEGVIVLTNYRLLLFGEWENEYRVNIPIRMLDGIIGTELFVVLVHTKDMGAIRFNFATNDVASVWRTRLADALAAPPAIDDFIAFHFKAFLEKPEYEMFFKIFNRQTSACDNVKGDGNKMEGTCNGDLDSVPSSMLEQRSRQPWRRPDEHSSLISEFKRMKFNEQHWRITDINRAYEVCKSYPEAHIVPMKFSDAHLADALHYRAAGRFPSVIWRSTRTGAVIARCSQPGTGIFSTRNMFDEQLLQEIAATCRLDRPPPPAEETEAQNGHGRRPISLYLEEDADPGMLIVDARSYSAAFANRARGYGSEIADYYSNCRVEFGNLANIHCIRTAFDAMRTAAMAGPSTDFQFSASGSRWYTYVAQLLQCTRIMVDKVEQGCPVIVHCSDGWDRTPQLTALAQVCLDPHYRTIEGLKKVVEREWLAFGHKFADRCGHETAHHRAAHSERSPIFVQWLDALFQIMCQFPNAFEYNSYFLVKLAIHVNSCLFGDFLFNSSKERADNCVRTRTCSVWDYLHPDANWRVLNLLYHEKTAPVILRPSSLTRDLRLWRDLFSTHWPPCDSGDLPMEPSPVNQLRAAAGANLQDTQAAQLQSLGLDEDEGARLTRSRSEEALPRRPRDAEDEGSMHSATSAELLTTSGCGMISSTDTVVMQPAGSPSPHPDLAPVQTCNGGCGGMRSVASANSMNALQRSCLGASSTSIEAQDPSMELFTNVERYLQGQAASLVKGKQTSNGKIMPTTVNGLCSPPGAFAGLDWDGLPLTGASEGLVVRSMLLHYEGQLAAQRVRREMYRSRALAGERENQKLKADVDELKKQLSHAQRQLRSRQENCPAMLPASPDYKIAPGFFDPSEDVSGQPLPLVPSAGEGGAAPAVVRRPNSLCSEGSDAGQSSSIGSDYVRVAANEPQYWMPDQFATNCNECNVEFSLTLRKHHCRKCGLIYCNNCTKFRMPVPDQRCFEPVRVCYACHELITDVHPQLPECASVAAPDENGGGPHRSASTSTLSSSSSRGVLGQACGEASAAKENGAGAPVRSNTTYVVG